MKTDIGSFAPPGKKAETSGEKKGEKIPPRGFETSRILNVYATKECELESLRDPST